MKTNTFIVIALGILSALFFMATDKVQVDEKALASVEATQSAEVIFSLFGEVLMVKTRLPDMYSIIGILLIITGLILHSLSHKKIIRIYS